MSANFDEVLMASNDWQQRRIALLERVMEDGWSWGQLDWAEEQVRKGNAEDIANEEVRGMIVGLVEKAEIPEPIMAPTGFAPDMP